MDVLSAHNFQIDLKTTECFLKGKCLHRDDNAYLNLLEPEMNHLMMEEEKCLNEFLQEELAFFKDDMSIPKMYGTSKAEDWVLIHEGDDDPGLIIHSDWCPDMEDPPASTPQSIPFPSWRNLLLHCQSQRKGKCYRHFNMQRASQHRLSTDSDCPGWHQIHQHGATCWLCGRNEHSRQDCQEEAILFCFQFGLIGIMTQNCRQRSQKNSHQRGPAKAQQTPPQVRSPRIQHMKPTRRTQDVGIQCMIVLTSKYMQNMPDLKLRPVQHH
ncbi:hypothetical protein HHI36_023939 [Cryptolaemus montrouzieri]|uniref:CCHC-type domain-containing protein n=1 Tax=Cryptolaemus montrouzieri TaxID=559131 RepID=A0ABD2N0Q5_9CUCU